ncbi:MAG: hypothetical protein PHE27_05985 [Alphaproteobacteria bacterium]|nr:hypothetical protein [Alphaproteobacteria bacterium]
MAKSNDGFIAALDLAEAAIRSDNAFSLGAAANTLALDVGQAPWLLGPLVLIGKHLEHNESTYQIMADTFLLGARKCEPESEEEKVLSTLFVSFAEKLPPEKRIGTLYAAVADKDIDRGHLAKLSGDSYVAGTRLLQDPAKQMAALLDGAKNSVYNAFFKDLAGAEYCSLALAIEDPAARIQALVKVPGYVTHQCGLKPAIVEQVIKDVAVIDDDAVKFKGWKCVMYYGNNNQREKALEKLLPLLSQEKDVEQRIDFCHSASVIYCQKGSALEKQYAEAFRANVDTFDPYTRAALYLKQNNLGREECNRVCNESFLAIVNATESTEDKIDLFSAGAEQKSFDTEFARQCIAGFLENLALVDEIKQVEILTKLANSEHYSSEMRRVAIGKLDEMTKPVAPPIPTEAECRAFMSKIAPLIAPTGPR